MADHIRLILVRHGNTFEAGEPAVRVGKKTDLALTDTGREQARAMGEFLLRNKIKLAGVYSGALRRQIEAAQIITATAAANCDVATGTSALDEIDYGKWEGLTEEQIAHKWPQEHRDWTERADWPEGVFVGSEADHLQAIKSWLDVIRSNYQAGQTILGVSSNGIMRYFYSLIAGEWEKFVRDRSTKLLKVKTGNFCELRIYPVTISAARWNESPSFL